MSYTTIKFKLWAVIDGTEVEVVSFTGSFEMNRIPQATAVLPVGRDVHSLKISAAHDAVKSVEIQLPCEVHCEVEHMAGEGNGKALVPEGSYKLFEGFVTGMGYRRTTQGLNMAVEMTHWLSGLAFASTLSESSHPNNPTQFTFNAQVPSRGDAGAAKGNLGNWTGRTIAQGSVTDKSIGSDLWGDAIKKWFLDLTKADRLHVDQLGKNDGPNQEASKALNRIDGVKLPFDLAGADAGAAAVAIAQDISITTGNPGNNDYAAMAHTTIWDKLIGELAPTYMFSLAPLPDHALVIPFIPGLREVHNPRGDKFSIVARDLDFVDISSKLPRALRAVGIFGGHGTRAGGNMAPNDSVNEKTIGGLFVARDDGMVMFKQAPRYLSQFMTPTEYSKDSSGGGGKIKATAMHPKVGEAPAGKEPKEIKESAKKLLDNMAQALYANEVLKGRVGQLSGAVRFDIAPGSNISIEGTAGEFTAGSEPQGEARFGSVLRVTNVFDAENQRAGTAYNLAHIRTEKENGDDKTSVEKHPLYTETWPGDVLLEKS